MKTRDLVVCLAFVIFSVSLCIADTGPGNEVSSEVAEALDTYLIEAKALRNQELDGATLNEFYSEWLARFLTLADKHPNDARSQEVSLRVLELANGTGEFTISASVAERLLENSTTASERIRWGRESGEIHESLYSKTEDPNHVATAIARYQITMRVYEDNEHLYTGSTYGLNSFLRTVNSCAKLQAGAIQEYAHATDTYQKGYDALSSLESDGGSVVHGDGFRTAYDREFLADSVAKCSVLAGDIERAESMLVELSEMEDLRTPLSRHYFDIAILRDGSIGEEFRTLTEKWLNENDEDPWTGNLKLALAGSYIASEEFFKSGPIFEELYNHIDDWFTADEKDIVLPQVLHGLALFYNRLGAREEFLRIAEELISLYPEHHLSKYVATILDNTEQVSERELDDILPLSIGLSEDESLSGPQVREGDGVDQPRRGNDGVRVNSPEGVGWGTILVATVSLLIVSGFVLMIFTRRRKEK